jgi:hypothetical protein
MNGDDRWQSGNEGTAEAAIAARTVLELLELLQLLELLISHLSFSLNAYHQNGSDI